MAEEFRLPDIGEGLTEAEIIRWVVPVGSRVEADQTVVEVETDKAVVEIPSPFGGVVLHHGAAEGETVRVGEVLVVVGEEGEEWPTGGDQGTPTSQEPAPIVGALSGEAEELASDDEGARGSVSAVQALPLVRKMARELGVDLATVSGSGPNGRITREDVVAAAEMDESGPSATTAVPPVDDEVEVSPTEPDEQRRRLSNLRRTIAQNMVRSWTTIPHVTTFDEVDAARLLATRSALARRHDRPIPMEALLIKAVIPVLARFPEFNATLEGDELVVHGRHDVGVAIDTPDGLMVAVVRDAGDRTLLGLAEEVRRLGEDARERQLPPEALSGQTFTLSNIGALGGGFGTPIVPPDTTAIVSVGRAGDRPVARDGRVEVAPLMPLSLSYDHRIIDGGLGRRFVAMLVENLEEPGLFLVD